MLFKNGRFGDICPHDTSPRTLALTTFVISLLLSVTSILGNCLIILGVVLDPNKNLRRPFSWLIVNLAAADLIAGTLTDPLSFSFHLKIWLGKKIGEAEMKAFGASYFISCTASSLTIASLAFERYLSVRKPNTYRTTFTNKRIIFTVTAIWLLSISSPMIYFRFGYALAAFIHVNASLLLTTSVTCFTYMLMWRKVKELPQTNSGIPPSISNKNDEIRSVTTSSDQHASKQAIKKRNAIEEKVTKMFLVVLVAMFCCYGSSTVFTYLLNFCKSCDCAARHCLLDMGYILVLMNSSLNFFCYAMQSSRFRSAILKILKIKRTKRHYHYRSRCRVDANTKDENRTRTFEMKENVQMKSTTHR